MGASRQNFSSKWVHPEKNFKMGAFTKTFAAKLMDQDNFYIKLGASSPFLFTEFRIFLKKSLFMS